MWRGRYDRRALIGIALVYFILVFGGLTVALIDRSDLGRLVGDIHNIISPPTPTPGG